METSLVSGIKGPKNMTVIFSKVFLLLHRQILRLYAAYVPWNSTVGPILGGLRFRRDPSAMSLAIAQNCKSYNDNLRRFGALIRPNSSVIDVGANIGVYSCFAAYKTGPEGHVFAFEATPKTFERLLRNTSVNNSGCIICTHVALGNTTNGSTFIVQHKKDDSQNCLRKPSSNTIALGEQKIPIARLDDCVGATHDFDVLKIDVEGAELMVLEGASSVLKRCRTVLIEVFEPNLKKFNASSKTLLELLKSNGFDLFQWRNDKLIPLLNDQTFEICCDVVALNQLFDQQHLDPLMMNQNR